MLGCCEHRDLGTCARESRPAGHTIMTKCETKPRGLTHQMRAFTNSQTPSRSGLAAALSPLRQVFRVRSSELLGGGRCSANSSMLLQLDGSPSPPLRPRLGVSLRRGLFYCHPVPWSCFSHADSETKLWSYDTSAISRGDKMLSQQHPRLCQARSGGPGRRQKIHDVHCLARGRWWLGL